MFGQIKMNTCNCPCVSENKPNVPSGQANAFCNANTCQDQKFKGQTILPRKSSKCSARIPLNSMGIRLDGRYKRVKTPYENCKQGFVTFDNPKSYDVMRAVRTVFDRPNYTGQVNVGDVCRDEIYDSMYDAYGKGYKNYMDINAGQIRYYIDESNMDVYSTPNYTTPSRVKNRLFVDPNGIVKPEYERFPLTEYSWNRYSNGCYDACDSFTHDSLEHRQDLMARQQRKNNQQDWVYRWGSTVLSSR